MSARQHYSEDDRIRILALYNQFSGNWAQVTSEYNRQAQLQGRAPREQKNLVRLYSIARRSPTSMIGSNNTIEVVLTSRIDFGLSKVWSENHSAPFIHSLGIGLLVKLKFVSKL